MLDDKTNGGAKPYIFAEDTFVEPKSFLVVPRNKSKIVLANAGGEVNLLWYDGKNLSKAVYGTAKEGRSYAFINGSWQWTEAPSAGKENSLVKPEPEGQTKKTRSVLPAKVEENIAELSEQTTEANTEEQNFETDYEVLDETEYAEEISDDDIIDNADTIDEDLKKTNNIESVDFGNINNTKENNQTEEKYNPWFLGDMVLSAMSLFLVWRYQGLKKKVK